LDAANQLAALLDRDNLASWVWARVEHVFAAQKRRLYLVIRTIGLARATTKITLANLAYNMRADVDRRANPAHIRRETGHSPSGRQRDQTCRQSRRPVRVACRQNPATQPHTPKNLSLFEVSNCGFLARRST
jgi:hypothetical protein